MIIKIIRKFLESPLEFPFFVISIIICKIKSLYFTRKYVTGGGKIIFNKPFIGLKIVKEKNSKFLIYKDLYITPHVGGNSSVYIHLSENSLFEIKSDFVIGHGVRIFLGKNSIFTIGGKKDESDSGITSDTLIMVHKKIVIGYDFICAWNVFMSDSDWHTIHGQTHQSDVLLGDHVWVANSCNILKGTCIGNNCVIASNSKITNSCFPDSVLIGGSPAKIIRANVNWSRDIY